MTRKLGSSAQGGHQEMSPEDMLERYAGQTVLFRVTQEDDRGRPSRGVVPVSGQGKDEDAVYEACGWVHQLRDAYPRRYFKVVRPTVRKARSNVEILRLLRLLEDEQRETPASSD
jgi:hypothetical protein